MLQIDFEAFYDSIPLMEEGLRNKFVFRARDGALYRLRTLPTGARWSVAVGQAVTWTIVDIDTRCTILTMTENILIAAPAGEEAELVQTVRQIVDRIEVANLCTSPSREELRSWSDRAMLEEGTRGNVERGRGLEGPIPYLDSGVRQTMMTLVAQLVQYPHWTIAEEAVATYNDEDYDIICFTDASADGWGAIVVMNPPATPQSETITDDRWTPHRTIYQQRWIQDLDPRSKLRPLQRPQLGSRGEGTRQVPQSSDTFNARHSANAEPRAIHLPLRHLERQGVLVPGESLDHKGTNNNGVTLNTNTDVTRNGPQRRPVRVAVVIDHFPIAHAQRRLNGFGGIGRGYALNRLFEYTNGLFHTKAVQVVFFYIAGPCNPADHCSRNFGVDRGAPSITSHPADDCLVPLLRTNYGPICRGQSEAHEALAEVEGEIDTDDDYDV
ncbi:hypothetical protein LSM04_008929 [Trypanosoma melophagium]|uniref:uncharacterized protein n=1 Tax=Trypanosoma melophagium TaxID=715481 RepID=UPI00351AA8E7|nr:hypothetical protein LSM04_008929 [Trypanosoma melophagium]